ncbi:hypothetical protein CYMTET_26902 [Cymbomonas tetramitiformis]|uniref:Exostosin GT47 domain-containing protein n=1 Tax=Cymbomonas tetramitiformis TaxID=36881 RepID=A0AAE0FSB5_9CHLO|nr:hypothetical protein CYMTET_26902 [Cymbomonas tetramitiformis]
MRRSCQPGAKCKDEDNIEECHGRWKHLGDCFFAEYGRTLEAARPLLRALRLSLSVRIPLVANVTKDEEQADLFWLPIWPYGLCLAASDPDPVNSNSTAWHDTYRVLLRPCKEYLLVLNWMFRQKTWRRRTGRDHVFWANRWQFRAKWTIEEMNSRFNYMFANSIMLATEDRWAMPHNRLGHRSMVLPFFVESEWWQTAASTESRDMSAIFVGSLQARGCHLQSCPANYMELMLATREAIAKSLAASPGTKLVIFDASKVITLKVSDIAEMYKRSVFCPIPNGDVHTSKRFFCAIAAGCIPVIIADGFQPVYPSILDWTKFSIQLPQTEVIAGDLMTILNKIPTSTRLQLMQSSKKWAPLFPHEEGNPISR